MQGMTNFEALHPRAGGSGPERTQFASKAHQAPAISLASAPAGAALEITDHDLTEADLAAMAPVLGLFRSSGVAGHLADLEFHEGSVSGGFTADGVELRFLASERSLLTSRAREQKQHLDPGHRDASDGTFTTSRAQEPEQFRADLLGRVQEARVVDAWARGSLRSNDAVTFSIPEIERDRLHGMASVHLDVETGGGEVSISYSSDGETLSVLAEGSRLWDREAEEAVQRIAAAAGGDRADMVQNLQACIAAAGESPLSL